MVETKIDYHNYEKLYCEKNKYKYPINFDYYIIKYSITFINEIKAYICKS